MRIIKSIVLGINQLLIHLLCLVCIEVIFFYVIIKTQSVKKLENYISDININDINKILKNSVDERIPGNLIEINMQNTANYVGDFISINNTYVLFVILTIIIILILLLAISYIITGMFEYNLITTISSLMVSIPIQLIYLFQYNINGNPYLSLYMAKRIKEVMLKYIDSL